jgi:hypothetical protein
MVKGDSRESVLGTWVALPPEQTAWCDLQASGHEMMWTKHRFFNTERRATTQMVDDLVFNYTLGLAAS